MTTNIFRSIMHSGQLDDGTRRAAMENVVAARKGLTKATGSLTDTINEMLERNDRVTGRKQGEKNAASKN